MIINEYVLIKKLSHEKQAEIFEKTGEGYFYTHQGASACVFHNGEPIKYIGYVEFAPNRSRGNHYHKKKNEYMCIVRGNMRAQFIVPEKCNEPIELELSEGDLILVKAGCAHSYISENGAAAVEYSSERFEKADTYKYSFSWPQEKNR